MNRTKIVSEVILFLFGLLLTVVVGFYKGRNGYPLVWIVFGICSDFVPLSHFRDWAVLKTKTAVNILHVVNLEM